MKYLKDRGLEQKDHIEINPEEAIAYGAAIQGSILGG